MGGHWIHRKQQVYNKSIGRLGSIGSSVAKNKKILAAKRLP